jgi:hypothetical protein
LNDGSGAVLARPRSQPGGGWPALLADIRGEGGPGTAALLSALTEPSAAFGRWGPAALDDAWREACQLETSVVAEGRRTIWLTEVS